MAGFINGRCAILSGLAASFSPVRRLGKGREVVQRFLKFSISMSSALKNNAHQTYQILHVAQLDLSQAAFFADHLITQGWHFETWETNWRTYLHQSAYVTAMVVAYSRPFTESRGWPKFPTRLLQLDPDKKKLHKRLLDLRNQVYAHTDVAARKIRPIVFKGKPTAIEVLPPMRFTNEEISAIRQLIVTISHAIQAKLQELSTIVAEQT